METPHLSSAAYWESEAVDLRLNPKRPVEVGGLREFLENDLGLRSAVVLATSGSSGNAKFVVLSKAAVLASARAVNAHCGLGRNEVWLGGLSTFHVGGVGIHARAYASGAKVAPLAWDAWTRDGGVFVRAVAESGATLASLTPTHLWDLVRAKVPSPATLRGVFLGGGRIEPALVAEARQLGWPIWPTYGMSETASQVATSLGGDGEWLDLLPIWQVRSEDDGRLLLRGEALFSGYAERSKEGWAFDPARDAEGWFRSGDRVALRDGRLRFLSRCDDAVKVGGELVSLSGLETRITALGWTGCVVARPDPRRGNELVLVLQGETHRGDEAVVLETFNAGLSPVERAAKIVLVEALPRTDLGKLDRARLAALVGGGETGD